MKKSILITGGTPRIGGAATALSAACGYRAFSTHRSERDRATLDAIDGVYPIRMDVTDPTELDRAFEVVSNGVGERGLCAVINNAGPTYAAPFKFAQEELGRQLMDINVMAPAHISQKVLPLLKRYNEANSINARIVNIASRAGALSQPFISFYNASTFAIAGMNEPMFYDLGPVDVHLVPASPGITKASLVEKTTPGVTNGLRQMPEEGRAGDRAPRASRTAELCPRRDVPSQNLGSLRIAQKEAS